ncbi:MAG: hypothetical protein FWH16_01170 [Oscillospiraceae bacterium]|nr:hypothetical protein [Oscillospiraceae bacterium]
MNPSFDLSGSQVRQAREYPIDGSTVIISGQTVALADGKVVAAPPSAAAVLGVAAENHLGVSDAFNPRSNGGAIKVYDSPTQVYVCKTPEYTVLTGDTDFFTCAAKTAGLKNGRAKLVDKEAGSTNKDPLGTAYNIISSEANGKITIDRGEGGGQIAAGDVFELYPPVGYATGKLNAKLCGISLDAELADSALTVVGHVPGLGLTEIKLKTIFA